jgi:hypothetical protein
MPVAEDLDNPAALIARMEATARGEVAEPDEMDRALADLLDGNIPPVDDSEQ